MAYLQFDKDNNVVGYARFAPDPIAGWQQVMDDDPRIDAFNTAPTPLPAPTKEELLAQLADLTAKINALS